MDSLLFDAFQRNLKCSFILFFLLWCVLTDWARVYFAQFSRCVYL